MLLSCVYKMDSVWRDCYGDFRTEDGKKLITNLWNDRKTLDYMHFMKFEIYQYLHNFSYFMVSFFILIGLDY
jgi:hypothetical protein